MTSPVVDSLISRVRAATSPETIVVFFRSARVSVSDTTHFGTELMNSANGSSALCAGQ
jgi:hypothetical protein